MTPEESLSIFTAMSEAQRLMFLARYGHELTIIARSAYSGDVSDQSAWTFFRRINEIQHRIFGYLTSVISKDERTFDDKTIVHILLAAESFGSSTSTAFENAYKKSQGLGTK